MKIFAGKLLFRRGTNELFSGEEILLIKVFFKQMMWFLRYS